MDDLTKLILTVVGTLIVGVLGALAASVIQGSRDRRKWLREKRYDAYLRIMRVIDDEAQLKRSGAERHGEERTKIIRDALAEVSLVGPVKVNQAVYAYSTAMTHYSGDSKKIFSGLDTERRDAWRAMQKVLSIPVNIFQSKKQ